MTSPTFTMEQAFYQFLQQWTSGLHPSLSLSTHVNGSVSVRSEVNVPPLLNLFPPSLPTYRCKRSGYNSRQRRRRRRAGNSKTSESESTHHTGVPMDNTVIEQQINHDSVDAAYANAL